MVTCLITGASLYAYLESLAEKVVVVISADLAHTHLASGPYGYSNASEPFDKVRGGFIGGLTAGLRIALVFLPGILCTACIENISNSCGLSPI